jgi:hypothetical protein
MSSICASRSLAVGPWRDSISAGTTSRSQKAKLSSNDMDEILPQPAEVTSTMIAIGAMAE